MPANGRWIIHELTEILATATDSGLRRTTGEQIPWREHLRLQHRKIHLLRAIVERAHQDDHVREMLGDAERRLRQIGAPEVTRRLRDRDLGQTP